jgi:hypothetical protein
MGQMVLGKCYYYSSVGTNTTGALFKITYNPSKSSLFSTLNTIVTGAISAGVLELFLKTLPTVADGTPNFTQINC